MWFRIAADVVVLVHLTFIAFVVAGGWLVWRYRRLVWLHLPAAAWGALIEFTGWICPLTPLEQHLRALAGDQGYGGGFIEHYIIPMIYPARLTPAIQTYLGLFVVAVNVAAYALILRRGSRRDLR